MTVGADGVAPTGSIEINGGDEYTNNTHIYLVTPATDDASDVKQVAFSDDGANWAIYSYALHHGWDIDPTAGEHTVYAKFSDAFDNWSEVVTDSIIYDHNPPSVDPPGELFVQGSTIIGGKVTVEVPIDANDNGSGVAKLRLEPEDRIRCLEGRPCSARCSGIGRCHRPAACDAEEVHIQSKGHGQCGEPQPLGSRSGCQHQGCPGLKRTHHLQEWLEGHQELCLLGRSRENGDQGRGHSAYRDLRHFDRIGFHDRPGPWQGADLDRRHPSPRFGGLELTNHWQPARCLDLFMALQVAACHNRQGGQALADPSSWTRSSPANSQK